MLLTLTAVAAAAPAANAAAKSPMIRHYGGGVIATFSGQSQCSLAVSTRSGAWLCPQSSLAAPKARPNGVTPDSGSCSAIGCWYYNANYWAEFDGNGIYGYGGTELGETVFYLEIKFSGSTSTTKPFQFESSRGVKTLDASGERLYFSTAQPNGKGIDGGDSYKITTTGAHGAESLVSLFGSTGYTYHESTSVTHAGVASQFQWTDPSSAYPGEWWVYIISPKFEHQSSGAYYMSNPFTICPVWYGSGWDEG